MNYNKIYNSIIEHAKQTQYDGYTESHHIIPKCICGTDSDDNLVNLTARQHYIAHLLLVKMYPGNNKLVFAAHMLTVGSNRSKERTANRRYEWLKKKASEAHRNREFTEETRQRMSKAKKQQERVVCPHCGKSGIIGNMTRWHFDNCKLKPGNEGLKHKFEGIPCSHKNGNVPKERGNCPYCGTESSLHYLRSHIPYCRNNPNRKTPAKRKQLICPYCNKSGDASNMNRWHFDNCKFKTS